MPGGRKSLRRAARGAPTDHHPIGTSPPRRRRLTRPYWWLLAATSTSSVGDGLVLVAFPLLAVTLTRRPLLVAGVAVAGKLPGLLVSLPAGAVADRVDRRRLVAIVQAVRAVLLVAFGLDVVAGGGSLAGVYVVAFTLGSLETAYSAATRAEVAALLDADERPRANGYLYAGTTAGQQFGGPALGGVAFAVAPALPFFGDAASFAVSAVLLARGLPKLNTPRPAPTQGLLDDVRAGLAWFRDQPVLRRLVPVVASLAFCQSAALSVLVLYGLHVLRLSRAGYGVFLAVGAIGDVAGSLVAHRAYARFGAYRSILGAGVTAAAGYLILATTSMTVVALAGCAVEALAVAVGNVATLSLRHQLIPVELFGRVNNAFRMYLLAAAPAGALAGGLLASTVGLHATFAAAGAFQLVAIVVTVPRLRGPDRRRA